MNIAPMKITRPCGSVLCATLLLLPTLARADNPWLPIPGATRATLSYVTQSADELYAGTAEAPLPDDLEQDSYALAIEHGLSDAWSLFANLGYASSDFPPAGSNDSGLSDTRLGVAWRLVDEYERAGWPTLTARAAAIIEGDYETGRIDAIGDVTSGYEVALNLGKNLHPKFSLWATLGYRDRGSPVPSDTFYDVNAGLGLGERLAVVAGYSVVRSDGDLDIGGPGFTPARFPEVEEERDLLKLSLAYALLPDLALSLNYAEVLDGRNTPISDAWGVSLGYEF